MSHDSAHQDHAGIRNRAIRLLAIREHSQYELQQKLLRRGFEEAAINTELQKLKQQDLLNENRFAEQYVHYRRGRGYGPLRITMELQQKRVPEDLIACFVDEHDDSWQQDMLRVYRKKFANRPAADYKERMRRARFLQYRGFSAEAIRQLLDNN
ncbi:MAG: recombination regulator RecX [gamma proteobacterium symbiont of Bathyaustriella thionipta]|nr:recombination regulator RecX [gamma proteobacterium symbiont of Bathyaustriella thionipta]